MRTSSRVLRKVRACALVLLALGVPLTLSFAAVTADAHHVEAYARIAQYAKDIRTQSTIASKAERSARLLEAYGRRNIKPPRWDRAAQRSTPAQRRMRKALGLRQLKAAKVQRAKARQARAKLTRLRVEARSLTRVNQSPSKDDRALVSADGTTVWAQGTTPIAHVKVTGCDGSTTIVEARDRIGVVAGPFNRARSAALLSGAEAAGSTEELDDCWDGNGRGNDNSNGVAGEKVTICHATSSATNPYVTITISVRGLRGHADHIGDIIPAPVTGCPGGTTPPPPPPVVDPPPPPGCTITGAFTTLGDVDGVQVRFDEALSQVTIRGSVRLECVVVRTCNAGLVNSPPVVNADGSFTWTTGGGLIEWVDVRATGAPVARRYESHAKCPYYPDPAPPCTNCGGPSTPLPVFATLLEPVSEICTLTSNTHAYLRSDTYRSIELRSCDGFAVRMFDDPMIQAGGTAPWPIGFGNGAVTLRDGTRISWELEGSLWTKTIAIQPPGGGAASVTSFGHEASGALARAVPVRMTDAQVRELAGALYRCRGSIANPLACGGPGYPAPTLTLSTPSSQVAERSRTSLPFTTTAPSYGWSVEAYADYSGACAPSAWLERARPSSDRDELAVVGGTIQLQPTRTGAASVCLYTYPGADRRATADLTGASATVLVQVVSSADAAIGVSLDRAAIVGVPVSVRTANTIDDARSRIYSVPSGSPCASTTGQAIFAGATLASAVAWTPRASGATRVCVVQLVGARTLRGQLDVDVAATPVRDLVATLDDEVVLGSASMGVTITGSTTAPQVVQSVSCSAPAYSAYGSSVTVTGTFSTRLYVGAYSDRTTSCFATFDPTTKVPTALTQVSLFRVDELVGDGRFRVEVPEPWVARAVSARVTDSTGAPVRYATIELHPLSVPCAVVLPRAPGEYSPVAPAPGRYRVCASSRGGHGEQVVDFVDDPGLYEAPPVPLLDGAGGPLTGGGSSAVVRRFAEPDVLRIDGYSYRSGAAFARAELDVATRGQLTWTTEPGTHGCPTELDPRARAADPSIPRSTLAVEPGRIAVPLGGTSYSGTTICIELRDDAGSSIRARAVVFPLRTTTSLPRLSASTSVAAGQAATISLTGSSSGIVTAFVHPDASRPCQTLAAEEAAVGQTLVYASWIPSAGLSASTSALTAGTWRVCAYSGDVWEAPEWFDTSVIDVGSTGAHRPTLTFTPTAGAIRAGSLQELAVASVRSAADGRIWVLAVPVSQGCPDSQVARPTSSVLVGAGIAPDARLRATIPAAGSWRLCGWQASESYTAAVARAELVVEVADVTGQVRVAGASSAVVGSATTVTVDGDITAPGQVDLVLLDDASPCPSDASSARGVRATIADPLVTAGPVSVAMQVVPRSIGSTRLCTWLSTRAGRPVASNSVLLTVTAPATSLVLDTTYPDAVAEISSKVVGATWSAPARSQVRAWTGIAGASGSCTDPLTATSPLDATGTVASWRSLPAGTTRVCVVLGVPGGSVVARASRDVSVAPLVATIAATPSARDVQTHWRGTTAVRGSFNVTGSMYVVTTTAPCESPWSGIYRYSTIALAQTLDVTVPIEVTTPGAVNVCYIATFTGGTQRLVARDVIRATAGTSTVRLEASTATQVEGEPITAGRLIGTSTGWHSLNTAIVDSSVSCAAATTWTAATWIAPGTVDHPLTIPAQAGGTRRICVRVGGTTSFEGSTDVVVQPVMTSFTPTGSGRTLGASGVATVPRKIIVGRAYSGYCSTWMDANYFASNTSRTFTVAAGAFSVTGQATSAATPGTQGCAIVLDSTGARAVRAVPFTFG